MHSPFIIPILFLSLFATNIQAQNITHLVEGGILAGAEIARNTGDFKYAPNLRYTMLYQVHPRLQIGGGIAYETFKKENLAPVYADVHVYMRETVNSPFFAAQVGYALGWHKDYGQLEQYEYHGGWMLEFDYGRRLPLNEHLAFYVALGLHFQTIHIDVDVNYLEEYEEEINYILLALKMGISF